MGAIESLVGIASKSTDRVTLEKCLEGLALCVNTSSGRTTMEKFSGIESVTNLLLSSEDETVLRNALWTLSLYIQSGMFQFVLEMLNE